MKEIVKRDRQVWDGVSGYFGRTAREAPSHFREVRERRALTYM
jgi:hypothetical protein